MALEDDRAKPKHVSRIALERELAALDGKRPPASSFATSAADGAETPPRDRSSRVTPFLLGVYDQVLASGLGVVWLIVFFAAGIVAYFALPAEPELWALGLVALGLLALALRGRDTAFMPFAACLLALTLGVAWTTLRADLTDGHQLLTETTTLIHGEIVRIEQRSPGRARLTLGALWLERPVEGADLRRVRITVSAPSGAFAPGDRVEIVARLGPPPEPAMPGARNLRRELFFAGLDATGFGFGRPTLLPATVRDGGLLDRAARGLARLRLGLAQRYNAQLGGDAGALSATLLVGHRDGLSDETHDALRKAGLAHLLAISGMHMAMMTLSSMAVVYLALALVPTVSASRAAMRWASMIGLVVASGYLALSGASTATQRAFVMIALALLAVLVARRALTLRAVAWAALIVLLLRPESLLGPSFQMSFAATIALIVTYGALNRSPLVWKWRLGAAGTVNRAPVGTVLAGPCALIAGIALTSLIAGLATAPFAAYHFSVATPLALIGNVLAMPLVSLVIMPAGLLALLLTPLALEGAPLWLMGQGLDALVASAYWVASFEGSQVRLPAIAPHSLTLLTLAGCLAAFLVGWARLSALAPLAVLALLGPLAEQPTILVARDAANVGIHTAHEPGEAGEAGDPGAPGAVSLFLSKPRSSRFTRDLWHQRLALDPAASRSADRWRCDALGCTFALPGGTLVAHVHEPAALDEDCRLADILITPLPAPATCAAPIIIDGPMLREAGAVMLVSDERAPQGLRVVRSFDTRTRPWEQLDAR